MEKKIAIIGSGISGCSDQRLIEAIRKLNESGIEVVTIEQAEELNIRPPVEPIIKLHPVELYEGSFYPPMSRAERRALERKNRKH